jgi:hypothetical protein
MVSKMLAEDAQKANNEAPVARSDGPQSEVQPSEGVFAMRSLRDYRIHQRMRYASTA